MMNPSRTIIGIIRHAPTLWNEEKRIQGQQDSLLSVKGQAMAEIWGEQLRQYKWNRILCSDLERVRETAKLANRTLHLPLAEDARLREQDWGDWTGMTLGQIKEKDMTLLKQLEKSGWDFTPPGGESRRHVLKRALDFLAATFSSWPEEKILVVCHEGIIKCLLYHFLGRQFLPSEPKVIEQYHLHLLRAENVTISLEKMNFAALNTTGK